MPTVKLSFYKIFLVSFLTILPLFLYEGFYQFFLHDYFTGKDLCINSSYPSNHICAIVSSIHHKLFIIIWFLGCLVLYFWLRRFNTKWSIPAILLGTILGVFLGGLIFIVSIFVAADSSGNDLLLIIGLGMLSLLIYPLSVSVFVKIFNK